MKTFVLAASALAIGITIGTGVIGIAAAADQPVAAPGASPRAALYAPSGRVLAEGAPCAPTLPDGRTPHYTWKAGYVQKARLEYHWACEL